MNCRAWKVLLVALIAPLWLATRAAGAEESARSPLAGVAGLAKPVTYAETRIPLGELVQKVAADTGVTLVAAPGVADEPVAVVVKDLPARELLEQLAGLLDYLWSRRGKEGEWRYEIWQDLAGRRREEALRNAVYAEIERRFRQALARYVAVAGLSAAQREALWKERAQRFRTMETMTPDLRRAFLNSPAEKERTQRFDVLQSAWSPIARSLASALGRLTEEQWTTLLREGEITFATDPQPGEQRLPAAMEEAFRASQPSLPPPTVSSFSDPEAARGQEGRARENWSAAVGYRVPVRLDVRRFRAGGPLELTAAAIPVRSDRVRHTTGLGGLPLGTSLSIEARSFDFRQLLQEDTPERRAALEKDPVVGVKQTFKATVKPAVDPSPLPAGPDGPAPGSRWWFRDLLPDLARVYGVHFISDAYWTSAGGSVTAIASLPSAPTPLFALLDAWAGPTQRWDRRGNLIRLRSRTWFFERPQEIPLRLARRWKALYAQHGALPLETYLEMAGALTDEQLQSLDSVASIIGLAPGLNDFSSVYASRGALRLYAALSPAQQQALWQGQAVPVAQMLPLPRERFLAAVKEHNRGRIPPLDLRQCAAGTFSMTRDALLRIIEQRAGSTSVRDEPLSDGEARETPNPAASDGTPAAAPSAPSTQGTKAPAAGDQHPAKRRLIARLGFQFACGPGEPEHSSVLVATWEPGADTGGSGAIQR